MTANYDIPDYPTKRLRYFNNQFLNQQDFIDEESYHIAHEQAHMRALFVAGVCEGLQLGFPNGPSKPLTVMKGYAVDGKGRMIVLANSTDGPAGWPGSLADGDYLLHLSFFEAPSDMAPPTSGGAQDNTRMQQQPIIGATPKGGVAPADAVVLGGFTVAAGKFGNGTREGRQYSGVRLPGPNPAAAAALRSDAVNDDGAVLLGRLAIRRDAAGQLGPVLTLLNGLGGAGAAAAIDFDSYDPGANDPALRLQSIDDGAFSSHLVLSTKQPGAIGNKLVERLRVSNLGLMQFPNEAPKDKLVIWETGPNDRYGIGLNSGNINVFCPQSAHFSLRQNDCRGAEVFTVSGAGDGAFSGGLSVAGNVTLSGAKVRNSGGQTIFETNANDWLRINPDQQYPGIAMYKAVALGTGGLAVGSWDQLPAGQLKVTGPATIGGALGVGATLSVSGDVALGGKHAFRSSDSWLRLNQDGAFGLGVFTPGLFSASALTVGGSGNPGNGNVVVAGTLTAAVVQAEDGRISMKTYGGDTPTGQLSGIHVQHGGNARMTAVFGLEMPVNNLTGYHALGVSMRGQFHNRSQVGVVQAQLFHPFDDSNNISDGPRTAEGGRVHSDSCQVFWNVTDRNGFNVNGYAWML